MPENTRSERRSLRCERSNGVRFFEPSKILIADCDDPNTNSRGEKEKRKIRRFLNKDEKQKRLNTRTGARPYTIEMLEEKEETRDAHFYSDVIKIEK